MVYIDGLKYACEGCIKGHRSSACGHTERPLFEIKKKGRPITQCEHCRQLRKTKQVHIKCNCGDASEGQDSRNTTKVVKRKLPTSITLSSGFSSHGSLSPSPAPRQMSRFKSNTENLNLCSCGSSGQCTCATPISTKKAREPSSDASSVAGPATPPLAKPISSCCAGGGVKPVQDPSSQTQGGNNDDYSSTLYLLDELVCAQTVPDAAHQTHHASYTSQQPLHVPYASYSNDSSRSTARTYEHFPTDTVLPMCSTAANAIIPSDAPSRTSTISPSLPFTHPTKIGFGTCSCGISCACPGCLEHSNTSVEMFILDKSCPYTCTTCNTCTDPYDSGTMAETRTSYVPQVPAVTFPPQDVWSQHSNLYPYASSSSTAHFLNTPPVVPVNVSAPQSSTPTCCGGWCTCIECSCPSECDADEEGGRGPLGFAVSGERGSCCGDGKRMAGYETEENPKKRFKVDNIPAVVTREAKEHESLHGSSESQPQPNLYRPEYSNGNLGQGAVGYDYDGWIGEPGSADDLYFEMHE